jgi:CDP-diacylglycerol--serine O-phosphatidyltransferase
VKTKNLIYIFPNLITITYVFAGFLSVHATIQGRYSHAALFIIFAAVLDAFDGIAARATGTQSEFGAWLDSLADTFAFGASAAFLVYFWGLTHMATGHAVILSFLFLAAGMLRLAGTAVLPRVSPDRKFCLGLSVPCAAVICAGVVLNHPAPVRAGLPTFLLAVLMIVLSLLMVSSLPYRNLFHIDLRRKADIFTAMAATVIISACLLYPICFLILAFVFLLSGPARYAAALLRPPLPKSADIPLDEPQPTAPEDPL